MMRRRSCKPMIANERHPTDVLNFALSLRAHLFCWVGLLQKLSVAVCH